VTAAEQSRRTAAEAVCWACGGPGAKPLEVYRPLELYGCPACGLAFQPAADADDVRRLYDLSYFDAYDLRESATDADRRFEADVRVRLVQRYRERGRLLELGAGAGYFLDAARRAGFEPFGIELSSDIAEAARRQFGVEVAVGGVDDLDIAPASFDLACAWHVVEHIPDPLESLRKTRAALRPGGELFVEVPNFGGVRSRRERRDWPSLHPRYHVGQYTPTALTALLERAGLEVVAVESVPFATYRRPLRAVLSHAKHAVVARGLPGGSDPWKHELLRAVARAPR